MNSFLPISVNPQAAPTAIDKNEITTESVSQVSKEQATPVGQRFSPVFAQILDDVTSDKVLTQKDPSNLEVLGSSDSNENVLRETQDFAVQAFSPSDRAVRSATDSVTLIDTSGGSISGTVRLALGIEGNYSGNPQIAVPKVLEARPVSQQVLLQKGTAVGVAPPVSQRPEVKDLSPELKHNDVQRTPKITPPTKDVPSGLQQTSRVNQEAEPRKLFDLLRPANAPIGFHNLRPNSVPPVTAVLPEAPVGFSPVLSTGLLGMKPISGFSSVVNELSNSVLEHRTTIPVDLLGESGLLGKGDRAQAMVETSVKSAGLDVSGGQGLGSGMNHFQNPQSGFQQPSTPLGQGMGLRGLEERGPEFPAPALQRLQMDVQLSENQRVSIDVGVQNRLVSAGLVMDHSVLRNLANQFVPELENQLADIDMELQEFSAQVREERDQKDNTLFNDSRYPKTQKSERGSQTELSSPSNFQKGHQEHGLHLVA